MLQNVSHVCDIGVTEHNRTRSSRFTLNKQTKRYVSIGIHPWLVVILALGYPTERRYIRTSVFVIIKVIVFGSHEDVVVDSSGFQF